MVFTHLPIDQGEQDDAVEDVLGHFPVEEPVDWDLGLADEPVTGRAADSLEGISTDWFLRTVVTSGVETGCYATGLSHGVKPRG